MVKGDLYEFLTALGNRESTSNYEAKNEFGFVGRWQFGKPRLYDLGISLDGWHPTEQPQKKNIPWTVFKKDTLMQDMVALKHVRLLKNYFYVRDKYKKYLNKRVKGIEITLSGLIAGAHLKGIGGVNQFLEGNDNEDAYGTKVSSYISEFGGYDLTE